jgi:translation initiation factor IF-3
MIPIRVNHRIKASQVRVTTEEGSDLGVLPRDQALSMAMERGEDLIEITPDAIPPVCRIMDFGKYRYLQLKARKDKQ